MSGKAVVYSKQHLQRIIEKTIKEKGPKCDLNFIDQGKRSQVRLEFY